MIQNQFYVISERFMESKANCAEIGKVHEVQTKFCGTSERFVELNKSKIGLNTKDLILRKLK